MNMLITVIADGLIIPMVGIAVYVIVRHVAGANRYQMYCRIIMAGLTSYAFAKILGLLFQPEGERPFEKLGVEAGAAYLNNPGFPSDHALFAVFLALVVWYVTRSRRWSLVMTVLVVLVCVGRVIALVHTPLDVFGGAIVGLIGGIWYREAFFKNTKPRHGVKRKQVV